MTFVTCDLCDEHPNDVRVCEPMFAQFGGRNAFGGEIVTIKCFEDNSRVKETRRWLPALRAAGRPDR